VKQKIRIKNLKRHKYTKNIDNPIAKLQEISIQMVRSICKNKNIPTQFTRIPLRFYKKKERGLDYPPPLKGGKGEGGCR
jgi:hypothetical protein